ncbi:hypothetical protein HELRODRAFT_172690 [Helobdella robusta]|uniref:PHD-type domain-containing protein n=1 Tax=Helobdella robusta TaxID=6412 RepID=T1F5S7_HELRO|nr:hypothetical protein HELRODRAFT_172690 [Helobdella robusta]ESO04329.1 hypothetical protein HELRODRAFT_172690 [Helobdella robusta]
MSAANGEKCTCRKCLKELKVNKKRGCCYRCNSIFHLECTLLTEPICEIVEAYNNLKWFCDDCVESSTELKGFEFKKMFNDLEAGSAQILPKLDKFNDELQQEMNNIKASLMLNERTLFRLDNNESSVRNEITNLKNEMGNTFADIVKREVKTNVNVINNEMGTTFADIVRREVKDRVDVINDGVKAVHKTLNDATILKERELNLVFFRLDEGNSDRSNIMKILKHLSDETSEKDIVKVMRLGKKKDGAVRPILVKFDNLNVKNNIMRNVSRMKSLSEEFKHIGLSHDLTIDQRKEHRALVDKAKVDEAADKSGFLYRVVGPVRRWRIVTFHPEIK